MKFLPIYILGITGQGIFYLKLISRSVEDLYYQDIDSVY